MSSEVRITSEELKEAVRLLAGQVKEGTKDVDAVYLVGIANGGIRLAEILEAELPNCAGTGTVNAAFHRDDIGLKPIPKNFTATELNFDVDGTHLVLVDDVLASGRTVRAAMNEIFDHGRPARIELAVLVDTHVRRLPIAADYHALDLDIPRGHDAIVDLGTRDEPRYELRIEE